ncbi:AEC family transporter [Desemzia sp. RIT804]|uniref:AEC family transporter n=1 Tax=Desemzia sp. RIT 804 TaxID=2810209 RepID=UPI00194E92F3|nr:AEC family transporter [Desemzia sp. RIT 804]MBM6615150.1 AEC family transporter [Desemzia sp. RIT 804]
MGAVLTQAISFLLVILMGYLFKVAGILEGKDGHTVSKIILNLTLPATIIIGFNTIEIDSTLVIMISLGLLTNILLVSFGGFIWRKKSPSDQALMMFSQAGYNIGNFTIPFVQGFFPQAIPFIGSFDTGNALMLFGGTPLVADKMTGQNRGSRGTKDVILGLFRSPSFSTYIVMIILALINITIPESILSVVRLFASGNAFLSMFMIGLYLELSISRVDLAKVAKLLFTRYTLAITLAVVFYFLLPLPEIVRLSLVLLALAPIGTVSTINMVVYGNRASFAGFLSSISIILSLILMTGALALIL